MRPSPAAPLKPLYPQIAAECFRLGQLYSKGVFLLGYWEEVMEFCRAIRQSRQPARGPQEECWRITEMFEQFRPGPGRMIDLKPGP